MGVAVLASVIETAASALLGGGATMPLIRIPKALLGSSSSARPL